jgi:Helix-turn-helix domain
MEEESKSPPAVAKKFGIDPEKVATWIRNGELRAINVATRIGGRPRWRILPEDLEAFLLSRQSPAAPTRRAPRRRRNPAEVTEYF